MRAYYNKRTDTITMIPEGERIDFRIRYEVALPKAKRKEMKNLLMGYIIENPNVLFMHPKARRRGHRFGFMSTGLLQREILPSEFVKIGTSLVIATAEVGDLHFSSRGDVLFTSVLETCIRKCTIDELLETL